MSHPNDTLQGRLLEWTRPEDAEIKHKFGYWRFVEERMIRATWPGPTPPTYSEVCAAIRENHANDPTYAERSARRQAAAVFARPADLTPEEWAYLGDLLQGANDPTGQSIFAKALAR